MAKAARQVRHRSAGTGRPDRRRLLGATGLTVAAAAAAVLPSVNATAPQPPTAVRLPGPAVPDGLPADLEDLAPYVQQVSCDPGSKPGAVKLGDLLRASYPGSSYSIGRSCGVDGMASEHYEGRAVDWFVSVRDPTQAARARELIGWLLAPDAQGRPYANARRLGVMYIIWNNQIWGSYRAAEGWRPYGSCAARTAQAYDTSCHRDHIHISLSWAGAMGRTSFWTRSVAAQDYGPCRPADLNWAPARIAARSTPCPGYVTVTPPSGASPTQVALVAYSGATVGPGSGGPVVRAVQAGLGLVADGAYGPQTGAAVRALQERSGLPATGRMDAATWRALLAGGKTTPPASGGSPSPGGSAPSGGSAGGSTALSRYRGQLLRPGSSGTAVLALQKALSVPGANGYFGPATTRAVVVFQKARRLTPDGVVGPNTWTALIASAGGSGSAKPAPATQGSGGAKASTELSRYRGQLLRRGSSGPAVLALQKALSVPGANGYFGPATSRAVVVFQKARRLTPDGVVGPNTWTALIG